MSHAAADTPGRAEIMASVARDARACDVEGRSSRLAPRSRRAVRCGFRCACGRSGDRQGFAEAFPVLTPQEIARELRVPIETTDDDPMVGSIWRFAEYRPRPPHIMLYNRGIAPLERELASSLAERLLGRATPRDVFVAHELYHHAEAIRSEVPIARRYQPTLFRIGNWQWRTGVAALAEIAAGAFAQSLLDLPCHPKVLDFVAVDAISIFPSQASRATMPHLDAH